eukprot:s353_g16.t2
MRLVDQWLGYFSSCRQGPPRKVGKGTAETCNAKCGNATDASEPANAAVGDGADEAAPNAKKRARAVEHRHSWVPVKRLRKKTAATVATGMLDEAWRVDAPGSEDVEG